jgi:hypothetical protein
MYDIVEREEVDTDDYKFLSSKTTLSCSQVGGGKRKIKGTYLFNIINNL